MLKLIGLVVTLLAFALNVQGQDVHLSQFYTADLNLNPAMGGHYDGDFRVAGNYRNQWREINDPITTVMVAFDKKLNFRSDGIDVGLIVIQDQFAGFDLNTQKVLVSGAYRKQSGGNLISAGLQVGMAFKSTDLTNQTFPNQWVYETGTFDQAVSNQESNLNVSQNFLDVNVGMAWTKTSSPIKPTIGFSLFHVNRPEDTYHLEAVENLRVRKVIHGQASIALKPDLSIDPKLMYMFTSKVEDMVLGGLLRKSLPSGSVQELYGGVLFRGGFGRNPDAFIPTVGLEFAKVQCGLSYDFTVSSLNAGIPKSSIEFSLIYTAPIFRPAQLSIPCDRY